MGLRRPKQLIKSSIAAIATQPLACKLLRHWYGGIGSILALHRVVDLSNRSEIDQNAEMEITPQYLEQMIIYFLEHGYEPISLDIMISRLSSKSKARPFVCFTFDDGYVDNFTHAFPVLKKYQIPFTIYLTTCFPDRTAKLWWYALEDLLRSTNERVFNFRGENYRFSCSTPSERNHAFAELKKVILRLSKESLVEFFSVSGIREFLDSRQYAERLTLSWDQVRELERDPLVTIGAHSVNHSPMSVLSEEELQFEISDCKKNIESHLKKKINHFAYPFGGSNTCSEREFLAVGQAGFKSATTTREGNIFRIHNRHLTALPRIYIKSQDSLVSELDKIICGSKKAANLNFKRKLAA